MQALLFLCRYAHCSVQRPDSEILVYGGFGCLSTGGLHSRLSSMIAVALTDPEPNVRDIELCGDEPGTTVDTSRHHCLSSTGTIIHLDDLPTLLLDQHTCKLKY